MANNIQISWTNAEQIVTWAQEENMDVEIFQGALVDSIIIHQCGIRLLQGGMKTKYILLKENYLNPWNSNLILQYTDSDKKAQELRDMFKTIEVI